MRKDFIDRWLLGEDLSEYCNSGSLSKLNILEKLLLVQRYYIEKPELC